MQRFPGAVTLSELRMAKLSNKKETSRRYKCSKELSAYLFALSQYGNDKNMPSGIQDALRDCMEHKVSFHILYL